MVDIFSSDFWKSSGSYEKDFLKGVELPFLFVGQVGGSAIHGISRGSENIIENIGQGAGNLLEGFGKGIGIDGTYLKYILIGSAALVVLYVIRK